LEIHTILRRENFKDKEIQAESGFGGSQSRSLSIL
jgi:hypothetical protein